MSATRRLEALESLRGVASVYVFFHHFVQYCAAKRYPGIVRVFVFGQAAVMLFFVLSGFVIYYSSNPDRGSFRFGSYFIRRFRRIYPCFLVALAATYALGCVTARGLAPVDGRQLLGNLLLLQDYGKPGNWFTPFFGNSPLWSLSYEWFFYMAFYPIVVVFRPERQTQAVLVASLLGLASYRLIPNQLSLFISYFPLWWSGVVLAREYVTTGTVTWRGQAWSLLSVATLTLVWGVWVAMSSDRSAWKHPSLELRHVATVLILLLIGIVWFRLGGAGFRRLFGWMNVFAPVSYALYILHEPFLRAFASVAPDAHPLIALVVLAPTILLASYLAEQTLQKQVNLLLPVPKSAEAR